MCRVSTRPRPSSRHLFLSETAGGKTMVLQVLGKMPSMSSDAPQRALAGQSCCTRLNQSEPCQFHAQLPARFRLRSGLSDNLPRVGRPPLRERKCCRGGIVARQSLVPMRTKQFNRSRIFATAALVIFIAGGHAPQIWEVRCRKRLTLQVQEVEVTEKPTAQRARPGSDNGHDGGVPLVPLVLTCDILNSQRQVDPLAHAQEAS